MRRVFTVGEQYNYDRAIDRLTAQCRVVMAERSLLWWLLKMTTRKGKAGRNHDSDNILFGRNAIHIAADGAPRSGQPLRGRKALIRKDTASLRAVRNS
jgi:hypothetical protein